MPSLDDPDMSLRERKKLRTRQHIVDVAAELFHHHGFDAVTVADVARLAEVGEQTVYNYFASKDGLVFDEADAFAERVAAMIGGRQDGETLTVALRREAHAFLDGMVGRPASQHRRGGMPYLIVTSPTFVIKPAWAARIPSLSCDTCDSFSWGLSVSVPNRRQFPAWT